MYKELKMSKNGPFLKSRSPKRVTKFKIHHVSVYGVHHTWVTLILVTEHLLPKCNHLEGHDPICIIIITFKKAKIKRLIVRKKKKKRKSFDLMGHMTLDKVKWYNRIHLAILNRTRIF